MATTSPLEWDVRSWTPALELWTKTLRGRPIADSLEVGARNGHLSLWLSKRATRVVCSDPYVDLEPAKQLHRAAGATNIFYRPIDARFIPYRRAVDLILFRSVIGALNDKHDQQRAFDSMWAALRPGGILLFAENLAATSVHAKLRRRFNAFDPNWRYPTLADMYEFTSGFRYGDIRTTGLIAQLGRTERQRNLLARLDQGLFNHIVPADWNTIAYGVAIK